MRVSSLRLYDMMRFDWVGRIIWIMSNEKAKMQKRIEILEHDYMCEKISHSQTRKILSKTFAAYK